MTRATRDDGKLAIVHVLRAPVGGLFRHVRDLAREQVARGHRVGLFADSATGGASGNAALAAMAPDLAVGLRRARIHRLPHWTDVAAVAALRRFLAEAKPDVVHGHGAKGGAYARIAPGRRDAGRPVVAYTPHGGSFHYAPGGAAHRAFMAAERALARRTDLFVFECAYMERRAREKIGGLPGLVRVAPNGVSPAEFEPVAQDPDADDFLYVGELRAAKGVDLLLEALAALRRGPMPGARLALVGSGPEERALHDEAVALGLEGATRFLGAMPARAAFAKGRTLVMPSRAESLPYVALEAAAATMPLVATAVGGMPEILGPQSARLVKPGDAAALAAAMAAEAGLSSDARAARDAALAARVRGSFSVGAMVDNVEAAYRDALAARDGASA
ncbi:MAG: glycosyltransferase family 4 protein [Hyphomicrobiales bacterium]|nr:glycosyltransferase family 4 protein [Hyphomicrobiales bacterium]